ncbi:MAG: reverse transcriptase family protein [Planctomycetaceae bacterium]
MTEWKTEITSLARAMLCGDLTESSIVQVLQELIEDTASRSQATPPLWMIKLASRVAGKYGPARPRLARLVSFLASDQALKRQLKKDTVRVHPSCRTEQFSETAQLVTSAMPFDTVRDVAEWLGISLRELDWFADRRQLEAKRQIIRSRNYHYRWIPKSDGRYRLVEAPKPRLRDIQRRLLRAVFQHLPVHSAAHGFRRQHSIVSCVDPHVGAAVILKLDVQDFFPSLEPWRLWSLLRRCGYAERVAEVLTAICSNTVPRDVLDQCPATGNAQKYAQRLLYQRNHFPQGAPTSPCAANLCAWRLDTRLQALAQTSQGRYTRYADDLIFSWPDQSAVTPGSFLPFAGTILFEEGLTPNFRKTKIMTQGQSQRVLGLVINQRANTPRREYENLKAILHNCVQHGPEFQNTDGHANFRAHLRGRIQFIESVNPNRSQRLQQAFDKIQWPT